MEKEKKTEESASLADKKGDMSAVYEVSYLLLPSLALEQVPAKTATIHDAVEKAGGQVISHENPILIDLAYPMVKVIQTERHKCFQGYFGWIKFEVGKDGIKEIKKTLDNSNDVLRYLIVKTVRENTLLSGKMILRKEKEEIAKKEVEVTESVAPEEPATPEEIDKSIDELVIN